MMSLVKYLEESFALKVDLKLLPRERLGRLSLFLRSGYEFFEGQLQNRAMIFAEPKEENEPTPDQLQKQGQVLRDMFKLPIVFVLNNVEPWERKRLIGRNIAFVQPGKQLYIPELLLDLSDVKLNYRAAPEKKEQLSYRAQMTLLYHLEVSPIGDMPLREIAHQLGDSPMNISRIVKELEQHEIVSISGSKEKHLSFFQKTPERLWAATEPLMNSPVKEVWYLDEMPVSDEIFILSYDTALAHYSLLNEGRQRSYAVGKMQFRNLLAHKQLKPDAQFGDIRVEVWHYNPVIFADRGIVDPLSLYLSMRDNTDERIKSSLEEMINNIKW
jgi:hypothetical protein